MLDVELPFRRPFAADPLRRFLAAHAIPGVETYDAVSREHARLVPGASGPALVRFTLPLDPAASSITARLALTRPEDSEGVVARIRQWLDLDAEPAVIDEALSRDPLLRRCVRDRPGLRVPGTVNGPELAMLAVLGQQVSLAAARTFAARLVAAQDGAHVTAVKPLAAYRGPVTQPPLGRLRPFPSPETVFEMGPDRIRAVVGLTSARSRTLHALAGALATGLALDRASGHADNAVQLALRRLPGIGPWTVAYIALRALGDADAFPAGDLVLRRALGVATAAQAEVASIGWRPWRAYGVLHLWTREVFS